MSLKYNLEVVTYPYSNQLTAEQIARQNIGNTFLRPILHGIPKKLRDKEKDLSACLQAMDDHFQYLTSAIGGTVVKHKWVLTEDTATRRKTGSHAHSEGLVMFDKPGLWLGALVDWVPGVSVETRYGFDTDITKEAHFKLKESLVAWKKLEGWSILPGELTDSSQYLSSTYPNKATLSNLNPVLVDLDII